MAETIVLDLDQLQDAISDLDESLAEYMYCAAVMCLHHNEHKSGVLCELRDFEVSLAETVIVWSRPFSDRIRKTFGDTSYAVEFAAEGISCLTIRAFTEYKIVERAVRKDGVDFWLADESDMYPMQYTARMESKGITRARSAGDIRTALRQGVSQSKQSDDTLLSAYIIATDFGQPVICMVQR